MATKQSKKHGKQRSARSRNMKTHVAYLRALRQIKKDGVCPFCPNYLRKYHTNPAIREGKGWHVSENMYPYQGAQKHFLLVHRKHITSISQIKKGAWAELLRHYQWLVRRYSIPGGSVLLRFGSTAHTGASVDHLHAQLVVGNRGAKNYKPVFAQVG